MFISKPKTASRTVALLRCAKCKTSTRSGSAVLSIWLSELFGATAINDYVLFYRSYSAVVCASEFVSCVLCKQQRTNYVLVRCPTAKCRMNGLVELSSTSSLSFLGVDNMGRQCCMSNTTDSKREQQSRRDKRLTAKIWNTVHGWRQLIIIAPMLF